MSEKYYFFWFRKGRFVGIKQGLERHIKSSTKYTISIYIHNVNFFLVGGGGECDLVRFLLVGAECDRQG